MQLPSNDVTDEKPRAALMRVVVTETQAPIDEVADERPRTAFIRVVVATQAMMTTTSPGRNRAKKGRKQGGELINTDTSRFGKSEYRRLSCGKYTARRLSSNCFVRLPSPGGCGE